MKPARVLVTGSAGRLGQAAVAALAAAGWSVRGFDRRATPGAVESVVGDLTDWSALHRAATDAAAMIHLAAVPDDDEFLTQLLPSNLVGLHHALEAARAGGVQRVLLASTGQVNWWQLMEGPWPIKPEDPITPRHWYAVTKVAAEAAGRVFARTHGLTVLALRLGWCPRTWDQAREIASSPRGQDTYLSPGDAGRFFVRALEADLPPGYWTLFVTSRPVTNTLFDLEPTRRLVGWEPLERWPDGIRETFGSVPAAS
ncbi:MAG TPA: NAD(P)-dependent oxidoreductase [Methylomirabilota bacterium]|nr:NAD(P)-dependent oxidoreductase [Methylomirabilota bacterium]